MPSNSKQTQWWKVLGLAAAGAAATFGLVWAVFPSETYIYAVFFERSPLQVLTVLLFWTALATLRFKHMALARDLASYDVVREAVDGLQSQHGYGTRVWSDVPAVRELIESKLGDEHRSSRVAKRIFNGLERLARSQSTSETREYFNNASEVDVAELESGFSMINYFIWLLPTLGFIGTVMGIGSGIAGFAAIIQSASSFEAVREALPSVTTLLGTAFDTTLLALLLSVIAVWYSSWLRNEEEDLLTRTDRLCHNGILPLFREYSQETKDLIHEIQSSAQRQIDAANANRIVLEGHLTNLHSEVLETHKTLRKVVGEVETLAAQGESVRSAADSTAASGLEGLRLVGGGFGRLYEAVSAVGVAVQRVEAAVVQLGERSPSTSVDGKEGPRPADARAASFEGDARR